MVSLDKDNKTAIDYVSEFIAGQWLENNDGGYEYRNIGYDNINKAAYRAFCLEEQENVCCYCSREIDDSLHTELEHIIPRSVKNEQELQQYFNYSSILAKNVRLQEGFRVSAVQQITPPFPHHIAYHNIVASCNGRTFDTSEDFTCCNRIREDSFIPPLNLMGKCIAYENDGTIVYLPEMQNRVYINTLNLNKQKLKDIRRLWFLFSRTPVTIDDLLAATTEDDYKVLLTIHIITNPLRFFSDNRLIDTFNVEAAWSIFMNYKYFLNFYRNNN